MADNADVLRRLQLEALGTTRRDQISIDDFNDATRLKHSIEDIERCRRVNQHGTNESVVTDDSKNKIEGWNSAWTVMQDDGILEKGLEDLNAGQSHRARLLSQSLPVYAPPPLTRSLPVDALDEARRFALEVRGKGRARGSGRGARGGSVVGNFPSRHARQRIPSAGMPPVAGQLKSMPRVLLPSITGRPLTSELKKTSAEVKLQVATGSSTATQKQTRRSKSPESAAPIGIVAPNNPPVTVTHYTSVHNDKNLPKVTSQPITRPMGATLLDTDPYSLDESISSAPRLSYTEDLLGIAIDKPMELPSPIEPSPKVDDIYQNAADQQDLHQKAVQLASFLPYLASVLPGALLEELISVHSKLQQRIAILDRAGPTAQSALISKESLLKQSSNKECYGAPRSLANAVAQRTREWSQRIITSTTTTQGSIFGEHITRGRWTARRDSFTSVAGSVGLVEDVKTLCLHEEALPQVASQSTFPMKPQISETTVRFQLA
ncbi:MAG: hypothetical protein LQ341_002151 [Variospora aurantia]|nr:MAG: hypothetical protein LQ341_002151 [Variospora aurantia]